MKNDLLALTKNNQVNEELSLKPEDVIKKRFDYQLAVVKTYVRFLQEVKDLDMANAKVETMRIVNQLVEQYNFGARFVQEAESYLKLRYQPSPVLLRNQISTMADIDDKLLYITLQNQFQQTPAFESMDSRFRMLLQ